MLCISQIDLLLYAALINEYRNKQYTKNTFIYSIKDMYYIMSSTRMFAYEALLAAYDFITEI